MKRHFKSFFIDRLRWRHWVLMALLVLVTATKLNPTLGGLYTSHVYPIIGSILSPVSGLVPFAVGDIFIFLSIVWALLYPAVKRTKRAVLRVAEYLLWVYAWFYMAWGLNYSQPNIYRRAGMRPVKVDKASLKAFAYQYADSLNKLSEECGVKGEESKWLREKENDDEEKVKYEESIIQGYHRMSGCGINKPFNLPPPCQDDGVLMAQFHGGRDRKHGTVLL